MPVRSYTYDANGNCTGYSSSGDQGATYEWDAEDRLVAVNRVPRRHEFTYDGFGRRVKMVEKFNGTITDTKQFIWDGTQIAEERDGANNVTKRFYSQGEQIAGSSYYYTRDHLGSVREMTDAAGNVRARYEYDPYGRRTKVAGDLEATFGFTGHYYQPWTKLHLALYRAYDADLGRWLNRDPIEEEGGINLYGYLGNEPLNSMDPLGLWKIEIRFSIQGTAFGITFGKDKDTGKKFFGLGVGVGAGYAASWDPNGKDPYSVKHSAAASNQVGVYTGVSANVAADFFVGGDACVRAGFRGNADKQSEYFVEGNVGGGLYGVLGWGAEGELGWNSDSGTFSDGDIGPNVSVAKTKKWAIKWAGELWCCESMVPVGKIDLNRA